MNRGLVGEWRILAMKSAVSFFLVSLLAVSVSLAQEFTGINREQVLFGVEYTFQDQEMVNEPGRNTISTPYKEAKVQEFAKKLAKAIGLSKSNIEIKTTWKPGVFLNVPGDGQWVINSEPVTIEVNTTPRTIDQLVLTSDPIFQTAAQVGLVAYVNPGAERSGMGHIHVGARNMGENPFFQNPLLLRNMMVAFHKNPALLHGFAEAFDIGMKSNIETYHEKSRQRLFQSAVAEFDAWYESATQRERAQGFSVFLKILASHDHGPGFFEHYRAINLEHVQRGVGKSFRASDKGKITVEFRNFRPPKDPATAQAFAELLMALMNYQSRPGHVEAFEWITPQQYRRFNTATKIEENWRKVRAELGLALPKLEEQIKETIAAVSRENWKLPGIPGSRVQLAYTEKTLKGTRYEIRLDATGRGNPPELTIGGHALEFEKIRLGRHSYWLATLDLKETKLSIEDVVKGKARAILQTGSMCHAVF
jgi:hypothetical protein